MRVKLALRNKIAFFFMLSVLIEIGCQFSSAVAQAPSGNLAGVQAKMVKIYGAGGFANLHSYQSGIFINGNGAVATVWSHVLDGKIIVVDSFGKRFVAKFVGMDPETELALLQTDQNRKDFFDLSLESASFTGMKIFGICNLFGIANQNEKQSVLSGVISGKTKLEGKSNNFDTPYKGDVICVDLIINNPGAAGGAVVDARGRLVGLIGKELKDKKTGLWLNFCLPVHVVNKSLKDIESGVGKRVDRNTNAAEPFRWRDIGLEMVPQVLNTTRPYVDRVRRDSVAEKLGFRPDDLVIFVNDSPIRTIKEMNNVLKSIDRDMTFRVTIRRGNELFSKSVSRVER